MASPVLIAALLLAATPARTFVPSPLAAGAVLPADRQWAAIAATARLTGVGIATTVGSAVCVGVRDGEAYLLTAAHVVPAKDARVVEFFTPRSFPAPAFTLVGPKILVRVPEADLALIKIPLGGRAVTTSDLAPAFARPKRFPAAAAAVGCPDWVAPTARAEIIQAKLLVRREKDGAAFYWETATAPVGGMSGGPLLDATGRVIGVCAAAQGGRGYYTHADEIHAALRREGYGWLIPAAPGTE